MANRLSESEIAVMIASNLPSMGAYWDATQTCRFANDSYKAWFGRTPSEMLGTTLENLLGPLYRLNQPYIQGALHGSPQIFERRIPLPDGVSHKDSLATYTPDISNGIVRGFIVQVSDITFLKHDPGKRKTAVVATHPTNPPLHRLCSPQTICAWCRQVQHEREWMTLESYLRVHANVLFSHGMCPTCVSQALPSLSADLPAASVDVSEATQTDQPE